MTQNATPVDETSPLQEDYTNEFDREIAELEQAISDLKQRQADIELAERERVVLERQRNELKHRGHKYPEVKQELEMIRSRVEELDLILESRLLNMWEPFWQAVRFGGLGIAIGWFISSWGR
jgi:DNA repair exonuclease SbcCD ATPase subunit